MADETPNHQTPIARQHFLENVVTTPNQAPRNVHFNQCDICLSESRDPVTTPCGHTFCRHCLTNFLTETLDACPTCRNTWYPVSPILQMEGEDQVNAEQRFQRAREALNLSRLEIPVAENGETAFATFGLQFDGSMSPTGDGTALIHATRHAVQYVAMPPHERGITAGISASQVARTHIEDATIATHLIAIGNIITAMAEADGKPFNQSRKDDLAIILRGYYARLTKNPSKYANSYNIVRNIRDDVHHDLALPGTRAYFFLKPQLRHPNDPLRLLSSYLSVVCVEEFHKLSAEEQNNRMSLEDYGWTRDHIDKRVNEARRPL